MSDLLTPSELAKLLRVGDTTISRWKQTGVIPAEIDEGRVVRYDPVKVRAALAERAKRPFRAPG